MHAQANAQANGTGSNGHHGATVHHNLSPSELIEQALIRGEGHLADNGALAADTGTFTGRSPKDKYTVKDGVTSQTVWWGEVNQPLSEEHFEGLLTKIKAHLEEKERFVLDAYACALREYRLNIRVTTETAYQNLFAYNLFLRVPKAEQSSFQPHWHIYAAPSFLADPAVDGTAKSNFTIVSFATKTIIIGGSGYTGEIKKGIFSVLNYLLPQERGVLSMHCSANVGKNGDTAVFFGLSGTGKTTLSSDPERQLIGDDEHGWDANHVFNFEGGCYAKVINLSKKREPQIFDAIRYGALLENINFLPGTRTPDYDDQSKTENTRAAYPIYHIEGALEPSYGKAPENIFFLTADAFGVLPPISKLNVSQAMFWFLSGYTAKVAGTEAGVKEPQPTFSSCFGQVFLPLHPTKYATLLGKKLSDNPHIKVWLINTGWTGGGYGVGQRMDLEHTRAMINAALRGELANVGYNTDPTFGLLTPATCPEVPTQILSPRGTWKDGREYDAKAAQVASFFNKNFEKYADFASDDIKAAAPKETQVA